MPSSPSPLRAAALAGETREATVLIVAQRVSTILHADRIVVLLCKREGGLVFGHRSGPIPRQVGQFAELEMGPARSHSLYCVMPLRTIWMI